MSSRSTPTHPRRGVALRASLRGSPFSDPWDSGFFRAFAAEPQVLGSRRPTLESRPAPQQAASTASWADGGLLGLRRAGGETGRTPAGGSIGEDAVTRGGAGRPARRLCEEALGEELRAGLGRRRHERQSANRGGGAGGGQVPTSTPTATRIGGAAGAGALPEGLSGSAGAAGGPEYLLARLVMAFGRSDDPRRGASGLRVDALLGTGSRLLVPHPRGQGNQCWKE